MQSAQVRIVRIALIIGLWSYGTGQAFDLEFEAAFTGLYFDSSQATTAGNRTSSSSVGLGDTVLYLKYRPIIQSPNSWRPSVTIYNQLGLPTSDWAGTRSIPGGFSPLGKLPATSFGALTLTEGVLFRKTSSRFGSAAVCSTPMQSQVMRRGRPPIRAISSTHDSSPNTS